MLSSLSSSSWTSGPSCSTSSVHMWARTACFGLQTAWSSAFWPSSACLCRTQCPTRLSFWTSKPTVDPCPSASLAAAFVLAFATSAGLHRHFRHHPMSSDAFKLVSDRQFWQVLSVHCPSPPVFSFWTRGDWPNNFHHHHHYYYHSASSKCLWVQIVWLSLPMGFWVSGSS